MCIFVHKYNIIRLYQVYLMDSVYIYILIYITIDNSCCIILYIWFLHNPPFIHNLHAKLVAQFNSGGGLYGCQSGYPYDGTFFSG